MRRFLAVMLACLLVAGAFLGIQLACSTWVLAFDASAYSPEQFSEAVYAISETDFDEYDWALYSPDELAAAEAEGVSLPQGTAPEGWADDGDGPRVSQYYGEGFARYRTDCLTLRLVPGQRYGIHVENATYAMRLLVDGELLAENGTVSDDAAGFVPQTRSNTVFFKAGANGVARIVMQRANFCHAYWNTAVIRLGAADLVEDMAMRQLLGVSFTLAALVVLALVNLGAGLLSRRRSAFLLLAVACLLIALKGSLDDPKPLMLLVPDLDWYLGHRLEHSSFLLSMTALALFWWRSLEPMVPRSLAAATVALAACFIGSYWLLPSTVYTAFGKYVVAASFTWLVAFVGVATWRVLRRRRDVTPYQWAIWAFMVIFACAQSADVLGYGGLETLSVSDVAVVCVALAQTVALAMERRREQEELDEARRRETELERMNESLAAMGRVRETYLQNLVHELKTPLAVIASYSGLTRMQLERGALDGESAEHLRVAEGEAARLGRMIDGAGRVGLGQTAGGVAMRDEDAAAMVADAAAFCGPVCQKRGNRVEECSDPGLVVRCNCDLVLQALYNLVVNASRHCEDGVIELSAKGGGGNVEFTVSDQGDGMSEEARAHAFERGWSGDGGTGYGLTICKDVADMHGGSIRIEAREHGGTAVTLSIPAKGFEQDARR